MKNFTLFHNAMEYFPKAIHAFIPKIWRFWVRFIFEILKSAGVAVLMNLHLDWYRWMHLHVFNSVEIQNLCNTKIIFQDLVSVIGKGFKYDPLKAIFESWKCSLLNKISIEMFQPFEYICATFIVAVFHWNFRKTSNWKRECEWNDILTSLLKLKCQFSGLLSSQDLIENPC